MAPLVVIVGETASGKSALAHRLAKQFNGEIISADSWAVYKGFDIGTAKPSAAEQAEVPYHLIDVAEPADGFSAVLFKQLANEAIADITFRGKVPFLVGGTGLYIDSILFDYGFLPSTDPDLRNELDALSLPEVLQRAKELQLDTEGIDLGNKRRVIRLIENNGVRPTKQAMRASTVILGLQTERSQLETRMEQRVDSMLAAGLEQEVWHLVQRYGWEVEPMKGIGYREFRLYFEGTQTMAETRERIIRSTVQLAKKQRTWFRRPIYSNLVASEAQFSANIAPDSITVQSGTAQSSATILTQKLSPPNHPARHKQVTRNNSIHWLNNRYKTTKSVELITTLLNT